MHHLSVTVAAAAALFAPVAAQAQHAHDRGEHQGERVHSHRGPGPHFIDAFHTENAYLERKIRPDVLYAVRDGGDRWTGLLEVEWAVGPNVSVILHAPIHHFAGPAPAPVTGLGDVSLGTKVALINHRRAFILATGLDVEVPTGSERRALGEGHWSAAPFVLAWLPFGPERRWLLQSAGHVDVPLTRDPEPHGTFSAAVSWTSPLGVTPLVEGMVEVPLQGDGATMWAVAPGLRWEFAEAWEAGVSLRVPVGRPREEEVRLATGLIRHFALPR